MHDIVGRAWSSTRTEHGADTCISLWSKSHKIYTRVHRNCESGLVIIYKHAAHRLVQYRLQVVQMTWTDDSTPAHLLLHPLPVASTESCYSLESSDQHRHSESGNQDKPHWYCLLVPTMDTFISHTQTHTHAIDTVKIRTEPHTDTHSCYWYC